MPASRLSLHAPGDWPEVLGTTQVAALLRVDRHVVLGMIDRGDLEASKFGRQWRIPASVIWPHVPPAIRRTWPPGPWDAPDESGAGPP